MALLAAALGCGGGQTRGHPLDRTWDDTDGTELASFLTRWSPATLAPPPSLYVGVVDDEALVLGNLDSGRRWLFDHALEGRPSIAGGVVVGIGGGELFALDGSTGELLWTRPSVGRLRGADDDGKTTVVSLGSLSDQRSVVLAVARDGRVVRQLDVPERVGSPAVYGDHAFLPWDDHWVVLFDLLAGRESARIVSTQPLRHAVSVDGALFFGQRELLAFDASIVAARTGQGTTLRAPPRTALTRGRWLGRAPAEQPLHATAEDTVRLYGRPQLTAARSGKRTASVAGNRYLFTTHRMAVALDGTTGATRWVHVGEAAFLGGAAGQHSFVLCDERGTVRWLERATGAVLRRSDLGSPVWSCSISQSALLRSHPAGAQPAAPPRIHPSLADQLMAALQVDDPRLLPLQQELLADLDLQRGDSATAHFIELAAGPTVPASLGREADHRLSRRRSGVGAMVNALREGSAPWPLPARRVPVAALARALAATGTRAAAPLLAARLDRPDTESAEAETILHALRHLAGEPQRRAIERFAARWRCDAGDPRLDRAVLAALRILHDWGSTRIAERVAQTDCASPWLRQHARALAEP